MPQEVGYSDCTHSFRGMPDILASTANVRAPQVSLQPGTVTLVDGFLKVISFHDHHRSEHILLSTFSAKPAPFPSEIRAVRKHLYPTTLEKLPRDGLSRLRKVLSTQGERLFACIRMGHYGLWGYCSVNRLEVCWLSGRWFGVTIPRRSLTLMYLQI